MTTPIDEFHRASSSISTAATIRSPVINTALFIFFYGVCTNIPYWFASHFLGLLPIGWFCVDYALVGILALFAPRAMTATLIFLMIAADLLSSVSKTYHLTPVESLIDLQSLREFSWQRSVLLAITGTLILAIVSGAAISRSLTLRVNKQWVIGCLSTFIFAMSVHDYMAAAYENGHAVNPFLAARLSDTYKYSNLANMWASRFPVFRLAREQRLFVRGDNNQGTNQFVQGATSEALLPIGRGRAKLGASLPNIVLVMVESWGLDIDPKVRNALVRPYFATDLRARYTITEGMVPFYGSTLAGEARELCGSSMGFHIVKASQQELEKCLPTQLAAAGYYNIAAHGMDGGMFERSDWYPKIGFKEQWFRDSFDKLGLSVCDGAFKGTCDDAIASWIGRKLEAGRQQPIFLYWVTLNSHLPLPVENLGTVSCALTPLLSQQKPFCAWYKLISSVHSSVAQIALSHLPRATVFIVVGDHAPPFVNPEVHNQFSDSVVPYMVLTPIDK